MGLHPTRHTKRNEDLKPHMKRRNALLRAGTKLRSVLRTGEHCPKNGWWISSATTRSQFIPEGSIMPSVDGQRVTWTAAADAAALTGAETD